MDERIERIWLKSCEMRGVSPEDIRSRRRNMVAARHDTWILCADLGISYNRKAVKWDSATLRYCWA